MDLKLVADTLAAMSQCRNQTTGTFSPLNVTVQVPPNISSTNMTTNETLKRRANPGTSSITWPCPTLLYVGAASGIGSSDLNLKALAGSFIAGWMWIAYGIGV